MGKLRNKVCAVIVTFNRKELLINAIDKVLNQTEKVEAIIIIDNASTDGTEDLLFNHGYVESNDADDGYKINIKYDLFRTDSSKSGTVDIFYNKMEENTGGAGGFHEGIKAGLKLGFDWLWLMDDDGYPSRDCLSILLNCAADKRLDALNPLVINKDNKYQLSFGLSESIKLVSDAKNGNFPDKVIYSVANPFNGTLLSRALIEKVGNVKKEMFIWGDESEYFLRLSSYGFKYATVVDADFYHPASKTEYKSNLFGLLITESKPDKLEMNFYRNKAYINIKYGSILSHRLLFKYILASLLNLNFKKIIKIIFYYFDGLLDRYKLPSINN